MNFVLMAWTLLHYFNCEIGFMNLKIAQKLNPFQKFLMTWWRSTTVFAFLQHLLSSICWAALQMSYTNVPSPISYNLWRTAFVGRSWTMCSMEREMESSWAVAHFTQEARDPSWPFSQLHAYSSPQEEWGTRIWGLVAELRPAAAEEGPCLLWVSSGALCV